VASHPELSSILSLKHIRSYPIKGSRFFARIGILPPELVVVDQRIKDLCSLPFWTRYEDPAGKVYQHFNKCPGVGRLPGCPPNSPDVAKVQTKIDSSDLFIVLQTKLQAERWDTRWKFDVLHRLAKDIRAALNREAVKEIYGSGPCTACRKQDCMHELPCKSPSLKTISLESMGICVDRLCSDLALLSGDKRWQLTWLKHFGLPQQTPKQWKYVEAIAVKL
ncbi:MAG: hypothetical protein GY868_11915, partial [Deltaproteobacteria bacterium]|nr:hypothetical protein [Deltaproteobacteria bacterium]